jgi:FMN phosphatase YigB (HAD superfamily)
VADRVADRLTPRAADPRTAPSPGGGRPLLVTDFDGTLYRGDAPLLRYAEEAAAELTAARRSALLDALSRYLRDGVAAAAQAAGEAEARALAAAVDGWEAVALLAAECHGVPPDRLQQAFLATRAAMARPEIALEVPAGYAELLAALRAEGVRVVLATNSPADGLHELLDRLGVRPLLDEVVSSTGKPQGLHELLRRELADPLGPGGPARVLAIGDHWRNDVRPARALGAAACYIDRFGRADGPATAAAPRIEELLPALRAWAGGSGPAPGEDGDTARTAPPTRS